MKIDVKEIEKIALKENDVLLVTTSDKVPLDELREFQDFLEEVFKNNVVIIKHESDKFQVIEQPGYYEQYFDKHK